jgi:hypothetical protein
VPDVHLYPYCLTSSIETYVTSNGCVVESKYKTGRNGERDDRGRGGSCGGRCCVAQQYAAMSTASFVCECTQLIPGPLLKRSSIKSATCCTKPGLSVIFFLCSRCVVKVERFTSTKNSEFRSSKGRAKADSITPPIREILLQ